MSTRRRPAGCTRQASCVLTFFSPALIRYCRVVRVGGWIVGAADVTHRRVRGQGTTAAQALTARRWLLAYHALPWPEVALRCLEGLILLEVVEAGVTLRITRPVVLRRTRLIARPALILLEIVKTSVILRVACRRARP